MFQATDPRSVMEERARDLDTEVLLALSSFLASQMYSKFTASSSFTVTAVELGRVAGVALPLFRDGVLNPYIDQIMFEYGLKDVRVRIVETGVEPGGYLLEFSWARHR